MPGKILITGCSRGIGHELALVFARHGWDVIATGRRAESPRLQSLGPAFPSIRVTELDVTLDESAARAAIEASKHFDALDVLVNNAAIFPEEGSERFEELDLAWFGEAFDTNVTGVARVVRQFLPLLRKGTNPRIVNISSGAGSISAKEDYRYYAYSVSKAALNMLTRSMAAEFRSDGIIVAAVSPGWVRTEMGGRNAPLSVEESAASLYSTISTLTMKKTGQFLCRDGKVGEYRW